MLTGFTPVGTDETGLVESPFDPTEKTWIDPDTSPVAVRIPPANTGVFPLFRTKA